MIYLKITDRYFKYPKHFPQSIGSEAATSSTPNPNSHKIFSIKLEWFSTGSKWIPSCIKLPPAYMTLKTLDYFLGTMRPLTHQRMDALFRDPILITSMILAEVSFRIYVFLSPDAPAPVMLTYRLFSLGSFPFSLRCPTETTIPFAF